MRCLFRGTFVGLVFMMCCLPLPFSGFLPSRFYRDSHSIPDSRKFDLMRSNLVAWLLSHSSGRFESADYFISWTDAAPTE